MKKALIFSIFLTLNSCATKLQDRAPSSLASNNSCALSIHAFFNSNVRDEVAGMSERGLVESGLLRKGEIDTTLNNPLYKNILLAENEEMRHESAKLITLIRKYRPELKPSQVGDFYHKLFHSCKL